METKPVDEFSPRDWLFGIQMTIIYDMPSSISGGGSLFIVVGY